MNKIENAWVYGNRHFKDRMITNVNTIQRLHKKLTPTEMKKIINKEWERFMAEITTFGIDRY